MMHSPLLRAYAAAAALASTIAIATLPADGLDRIAILVAGLAALSAAVGTRSVRIPGTGLRVTASDLFVFVALAGPAPLAAPAVAAAGTLGAEFGALRRLRFLRAIFNLAVVPLAAAVASHGVLVVTEPFAHPAARAAAVLIGAVLFLAVNLVLVAGAVALEGRGGFLSTIADAGPWTLVSVVASAVAGLGLYALVSGIGAPSAVLGMAAIPPTLAHLRSHAARGGAEVVEA